MRAICSFGYAVVCAVLVAAGCANQPAAQVCANGIVCPDGTTCAAVQAVCIVGLCGNGLPDSGETCDDGNIIDGDGCSHSCKVEMCGNGDMDPGELCDDGNNVNGDKCSADCKSVEICGNNIKDVTEECDDNNTVSGDGCSADCKSTEVCGNGIKDVNELCDDGKVAGGCSDDCQGGTGCGDGQIDKNAQGEPIEQCDDGNSIDSDDCHGCKLNVCGDSVVQTSGVRIEDCDPGSNGTPLQTATCNIDCSAATCGDGKVNPLNKSAGGATSVGEQCDDANTTNGDGCDNNCTIPACGNKIVDPNEACDDGNLANGDGCDNNCKITACGNGIKTGTEACDDGNIANNDGCSGACVIEFCGDNTRNNGEDCDTNGNSQTCNADCTAAACGDGKINASFKPTGAPRTEQCDDDNIANNDGCSSLCQFERCGDGVRNNGEVCDDGGNSALCNADCSVPECGDGKINPLFKPDGIRAEQCDDDNILPNDGCSMTCQFERCGNGIVDPGEQCDTAPVSGFACVACHLVKCGDGILDSVEECDDGNNLATDDCVSNSTNPLTCKIAVCGDSVINADREDCDNGSLNNGTPGNACSATCQTVACGNGILDPGEECDDHNTSNADDCLSSGATAATTCKHARCGDGITQSVGNVEDCDNGVNNGTPGNACSADCRAQVCGNGTVDSGETCDDGNALACGACSAACSVVAPAEAATGLIVAPAGSTLVAGDSFRINDGLGVTNSNILFKFVAANPGAGEITIENITNVAMAAKIINAISGSGLQIQAVQIPNTALITLTHRVRTTRGNQLIVNSVATTNFAATGMSGGHSGDCLNNNGCTLDSDCASNRCDADQCKACTANNQCESNVCVLAEGRCQ